MKPTPDSRPDRRARRALDSSLAPLAVALASAALALPIFDRFSSGLDEGHILAFADLVARGDGQLYRDATLYPLPGAFYLLAGVFRLFEPSILAARWTVLVEFALFAALFFAWLRRCVSAELALAGVAGLWLVRIWAFPHWQMYSYSTTALLVLATSLWLLVRALERDSLRALAAAGVVFGLGVFCKQDYGAAFALASAATLGLASRGAARSRLVGRAASFAAGAAAVGGLAALHFAAQGQLALVLRMTLWNAFEGLSRFAYTTHPSPWPLFGQDAGLRDPIALHTHFPSIVETVHGAALRRSAWFRDGALYELAIKLAIYGPMVFSAAFCAGAWKLRAALDGPATRARALHVAALASVALTLSLLALLNRPQDFLHSAVLWWPLPGLFAVLAGSWPRRRNARRVAAAAALALLVAPVAYSAWLAVSLRTVFSQPIPLARAGVYERPADAALLAELVAHLHSTSRPDEAIAVLPYYPLLHFLSERGAAHGASYLLWPFPEIPERDRRVIEALEAARVPLVLYHPTQLPQFPPMSDYAPELQAYLVANFRSERVFGREAFGPSFVALRREPAPAGRELDFAGAQLGFEWPGGVARPGPQPSAQAWRAVPDWPFRPALALRPTHGGRTLLRVPLPAPAAGARIESAVGVHPKLWARAPASPVRFSLVLDDGERRERVFERTLNPHLVLADRGWFELRVPLDDWRGRELHLEFRTELGGAPLAEAEAMWMGGWEWPRLVEGEAPR